MSTVDDIHRWATALPEVEETSHFRFHVPVFKVRGKTFSGMGADCETVVFCIDEQDANQEAAAEPESCQPVRRQDARRSFLGLQMRLDGVPDERVKRLVEQAWRQKAPKRLVAQRDDAV